MRPPVTFRFHADRWHMFRIYAAAAQMQMQQVDSIAMAGARQPTLLVLRSNVEGVQWWKINQAVPVLAADPVLPKRILRPFEVTTDLVWSSGTKPAIVINNPTSQPARIDVFYATKEVEGGGGGGGGDF
jgi:hypothetical protein